MGGDQLQDVMATVSKCVLPPVARSNDSDIPAQGHGQDVEAQGADRAPVDASVRVGTAVGRRNHQAFRYEVGPGPRIGGRDEVLGSGEPGTRQHGCFPDGDRKSVV